ncbi:hypothetical protein BDV18DRAFT_131253 [Aspergillus unguis]
MKRLFSSRQTIANKGIMIMSHPRSREPGTASHGRQMHSQCKVSTQGPGQSAPCRQASDSDRSLNTMVSVP